MKPYKVVKILNKPEKMKLRLDGINLEYWGVSVTLQYKSDIHDSTVTFESLEDAQKLKVEDVFYR